MVSQPDSGFHILVSVGSRMMETKWRPPSGSNRPYRSANTCAPRPLSISACELARTAHGRRGALRSYRSPELRPGNTSSSRRTRPRRNLAILRSLKGALDHLEMRIQPFRRSSGLRRSRHLRFAPEYLSRRSVRKRLRSRPVRRSMKARLVWGMAYLRIDRWAIHHY